ncbi:Phosphatidyl-N-methylethanolamine N-methyltransferase [Naganishia albida]|nr:Phosphatidyl-N-methylethanolamine N-methyltransferase [Naganishia albida]
MDYLKARLNPDIAYTPLHKSAGVAQYVDVQSPWLWLCVGSVVFNPVFWNTVARNEYRNKSMTKIFGGPYNGTYVLAVIIFSLGIFRDLIYEKALLAQPVSPALAAPLVRYAGAALFVVGQVLVITSIWALGITGTYLGDYFGILMSHRVTSFPFNILENPMYNGSTLCFLGTALWYARPAGVVITAVVFVVYEIALMFEGPFTSKIYSSAAAKKRSDEIKSSSSETAKTVQDTANAAISSAVPSGTSSGTTSARQPLTSSASYARAAAQPASSSGLESTNPRPVPGLQELGLGAPVQASSQPRVTRTRSRAGRVVDDD